jgi:competence protein ComEC
VLLPGDLETEGERRLLAAEGDGLASAVLKVPHHGSRTSSTGAFLDAVRPRVAVISAGRENHFGLPHPAVVATYVRRGIALHRTDRDGAVSVTIASDGSVKVERHRAATW